MFRFLVAYFMVAGHHQGQVHPAGGFIVGEHDPHEVDTNSRIRQIGDRYGAKGLGLVGPIFPGVTASVVIGLSLGFERTAIARWMSIGVAAMFAVCTLGLWLLVELVGVG